ncbi:MAG: ABC transporter ATP-binding protein [Clostridiales bacterium]|nr:ABC transporter ATP-binding protein [Clostridiales bacterium]
MQILQVKGLSKHFGGRAAVSEVDFHVDEGEIFGLIGPNGAGKSTVFNLISGALPPDEGEITIFGVKTTGMRPNKICRLGVGRTFQSAKNFSGMTVRQNVLMGALFGKRRQSKEEAVRRTDEVLAFTGLAEMADRPAGGIPLVYQKRLEVARALATQPRLLMLDEIMAGLNPTEVQGAMDLVRKIRSSGVTVLMIEHVMHAIMNVCDRIIVLHHGAKIAEGTPEEVSSNKTVIEVYLGEMTQ